MANFHPALQSTLKYEGGYCHVPGDAGGETYCGVARNFFPKDPLWVIIDRINKQSKLKNNQIVSGEDGVALSKLIADFYKAQFWDKMRGDDIHSQSVAAYLFDWGVTSGNVAAMQVQGILGIAADGVIGNHSVQMINAANAADLWKKMVDIRVKRAQDRVARDQSQAKFLKGWLNRFQGFKFED